MSLGRDSADAQPTAQLLVAVCGASQAPACQSPASPQSTCLDGRIPVQTTRRSSSAVRSDDAPRITIRVPTISRSTATPASLAPVARAIAALRRRRRFDPAKRSARTGSATTSSFPSSRDRSGRVQFNVDVAAIVPASPCRRATRPVGRPRSRRSGRPPRDPRHRPPTAGTDRRPIDHALVGRPRVPPRRRTATRRSPADRDHAERTSSPSWTAMASDSLAALRHRLARDRLRHLPAPPSSAASGSCGSAWRRCAACPTPSAGSRRATSTCRSTERSRCRANCSRSSSGCTQTLDELAAAFDREKQATADISHELRTPLAALLTTHRGRPAQAALGRRVPRDARGLPRQRPADAPARRAAADPGPARRRRRSRCGRATVDVGELAEQCAALVRPLAERTRAGAARATAPSRSSWTTDPDKLREVLTNLLHNAIQYNRPDGGDRRDRAQATTAGCDVEVHDTGIGIAPEAFGAHLRALLPGRPVAAGRRAARRAGAVDRQGVRRSDGRHDRRRERGRAGEHVPGASCRPTRLRRAGRRGTSHDVRQRPASATPDGLSRRSKAAVADDPEVAPDAARADGDDEARSPSWSSATRSAVFGRFCPPARRPAGGGGPDAGRVPAAVPLSAHATSRGPSSRPGCSTSRRTWPATRSARGGGSRASAWACAERRRRRAARRRSLP